MYSYSTPVATTNVSSSYAHTRSSSQYSSSSYSSATPRETGTFGSSYSLGQLSTLSASPAETRSTSILSEKMTFAGSTTDTLVGSTYSTNRSTSYQESWNGTTNALSTVQRLTVTVADTGTTVVTFQSSTLGITTRGTYQSGTVSSTLATTGATTTTVTSATTQPTTTTASPLTTNVATTTTRMTTTSVPATSSYTTYATAPSTTLSAPELFAGVTVAEPGEQLWEVTATDYTADFISNLASTITGRTGTLATVSAVRPVTDSSLSVATYTTSFSSLSVTALGTVSTTVTTQSIDTYITTQRRYPMTVTATRTFAMLTVSSTTVPRAAWTMVTSSSSGYTVGLATGPVSQSYTTSTSATITINASPTSTTLTTVCVTYSATTAVPGLRPSIPIAASYSSSLSASATSTATATASTSTSSYVTTGFTWVTNYVNVTDTNVTITETYTSSGVLSTSFTTEECGAPFSILTFSGSYPIGGGITEYTYYTITHDTPNPHSISFETWTADTYSLTNYSTYLQSFLGSITGSTAVNASTTRSTVVTFTQTNSSVGSTTSAEGMTLTYGLRYPQITSAASAGWTAFMWRQVGGFAHPLNLGSGGLLFTQVGTNNGPFAYGSFGTQNDSFGALAPMLLTAPMTFSTNSSVATAQWDVSDSRLHVTTGVTSTRTITYGVTSITTTQTITTNTSAFTESFVTSAPATYYSMSSLTSAGSRIGGQPWNTAHGVMVTIGPGVRHSTTQSSQSSASGTEWNTGSLAAGTGTGFAFPLTSESAYLVAQTATDVRIQFAPLFTGATARPLVALSLYPNL